MKNFSKQVKNVIVVYRSYSREALFKAREIEKFFLSRGVQVKLFSQKQTNKARALKSQLIVAVGGDGTYLKAVHFGKSESIPILGVNMGSLGFLTPHHEKDALFILDKFLKGRLFLRKNFFLQAGIHKIKTNGRQKGKKHSEGAPPLNTLDFSHLPLKSFQAVNDIVIERGALGHLISLSVYINNQYICCVKSDGLIIAGPLGSTAYNLAAGGPILHPKVNSFVITPICSHSLTNRPVIIHDKSEIQIKVNEKKAFLSIDGIKKQALTPKNLLIVRKDKKSFFSLTEKKQWEFDLLREKLQFGQRN